jgi:hypothetical protein
MMFKADQSIRKPDQRSLLASEGGFVFVGKESKPVQV